MAILPIRHFIIKQTLNIVKTELKQIAPV